MFDWLGDTWDSFTGWLGSDDTSSGGSDWLSSTDFSTAIPNTAQEGEPGYGWQYFSDGTVIDPQGKYYYQNELVYDPSNPSGDSGILNSLFKGATGALTSLISTNGKTDPSKIASLAGGILGGINPSWMQPDVQKTGYQGGIPSYSAVREQVPGTYDPNRRPGSRGQEYFTDVQYTSPTDVATAQAAAAQQATEAEARNKAREAEAAPQVSEYAVGGLTALAKGRYLSGPTDGMADKLPATIENKQPAKLSHGEFVVPADVVGHLGNGNSEAGAQRLYDMMDRIRKARTGTTKQGKQINPNKFMPG